MMNLSINLTLGSPGADTVLNTAPAEEGAADSFSQALADELNGQELTRPAGAEDNIAPEPGLLALFATWQPLAADAETAGGKQGQIWLDDPVAGIADAEAANAEAAETEGIELPASEKPWFDIIEKAKNYSPVMQANKTATEAVADAATEHQVQQASTEPAAMPLTDAGLLLTETAAAIVPQTTLETTSSASEVHADSATEQPSPLQAGESPVATATTSTSGVAADNTVSPQQLSAEQTPVIPATTSADGKVAASPDQPVAAIDRAADVAKPTQPVATPVNHPAADTDVPAGAAAAHQDQAVALTSAPAETAVAAAVQTRPQQAEQKLTPGHSSAASETVAAPQPTVTDTVQQAALITDTLVVTSKPVQTGTAEKTPAANAFAEHLKTVNQTQLQQQQSGAEQQPGQGQAQAKASADALTVNVSAAPAVAAPVFAQQLQQASEAPASAVPAAQPISHSAASTSANATLLSARPTDITPWQAPLALADPSAAQQIKDRVMVQIQHKLQTAEVQLHPEDLGSMQIKLNLQQDQLSVQFIVQQGAAKEALEQQMPRLRDMLEQQGILLSEGQVEQRQAGSGHEQQQSRQSQAHDVDVDVAPVQTVQMRVSDRVVDFYA